MRKQYLEDMPKSMDAESIFTTARSEGPMRDVLTVECMKLNENDFKGTVTYSEAQDKIFTEALGLSPDLLHSLKFGYSSCRTVTFKLKKQIYLFIYLFNWREQRKE